MPQPSAPSAQVTAAEISRIAGVTRATVSNWRRRHDDFPAPSGGTDSSPLYDLEEVRAWLASRGQHTAATPSGELRTTLRLREQGVRVCPTYSYWFSQRPAVPPTTSPVCSHCPTTTW